MPKCRSEVNHSAPVLLHNSKKITWAKRDMYNNSIIIHQINAHVAHYGGYLMHCYKVYLRTEVATSRYSMVTVHVAISHVAVSQVTYPNPNPTLLLIDLKLTPALTLTQTLTLTLRPTPTLTYPKATRNPTRTLTQTVWPSTARKTDTWQTTTWKTATWDDTIH